MLTLFLLLVVPQIHSKFYSQNVTDLSKCSVHYSRSDNNYKDFYEISDDSHKNGSILDFHFSVLAPSDAHILLTPVVKPIATMAVYEIVLGAGGDSFSDIRRAQKASVQTSFRHPNGILSALDPQSFWIHISKEGVIEVGREGDKLPFVNWRDPNPLTVKYFSFGTWTGVEAKWYFDCPREDNTTTIKEIKTLTNLERLRQDLLSSYDPYVRPVLNHTTVTTVSLKLNARFLKLNERRSALNVEGWLKIRWNDEKMIWNPKKYGNISDLHLLGRQIWQPNLVLQNAMSLVQDNFVDDSMMTVTSNGSVNWNPAVHLNVWCNAIKLGHWPSDNHTCEIIFGVSPESNLLKLHVIEGKRNKISEQEWKVLNIETSSTFETLATDRPRFLKYIFKFTRNSEIYNAVFFVPFLVVATCMLLTFCVSPFDFSKISLCCLQLLIITVVSVILFDVLPSHPEKLPYLVVLYGSSYVASIFCVILSAIVMNVSRFSHKRPVPHCLWQTLMLAPVQKLFLLPSVKMAQQYGKLSETSTSATKISESVQNTWIVLGIFIDRLAFLAYFIFIIIAITHKY